MEEENRYRIGQKVQVTFIARVAEVGGPQHAHQTGRIIRLETRAIPTGWVDPADEHLTIAIVSTPLPTAPGMYWQDGGGTLNQDADGKAFHYLNTEGKWVDLGWGRPDDEEAIYPLVETPF